jgi:hypothetical protein
MSLQLNLVYISQFSVSDGVLAWKNLARSDIY